MQEWIEEKFDFLKVISKGSRSGRVVVKCTVCSGDPEIWGDAVFDTAVGSLKKGILPCGCGVSPRYSLEQREVMIRRSMEGSGYTFTGWVDGDGIMSSRRFNYICEKHGHKVGSVDKWLNSGRRCMDCGMDTRASKKTIPFDEFVKRAVAVHGNKYEYHRHVYQGFTRKTQITCQTHGSFEQTPLKHISGQGCVKCSGKILSDTESFIKEAHRVHGDRYDYSLVEYTGSGSKVKVVCGKHGVFEPTPCSHVYQGTGCPRCAGTVKKTTQEFIIDAIEVHGNTYDYSKAVYEGAHKKVTIVCRKHGEFLQTPHSHINSGSGCNSCMKNGFDDKKESWVYVVELAGSKMYTGFGITNDIGTRLRAHKLSASKLGYTLNCVTSFKCTGIVAKEVEAEIKKRFHVVNTGIAGFKTEATHASNYEKVVEMVKEYIDG